MEAYEEVEKKYLEAEEKRNEIVRPYADKSGQVPQDKRQEVVEKINEMLMTETTINNPPKFTQEDLKKAQLDGMEIYRLKQLGFIADNNKES
jgi:hypothetical protein